MPFENSHACLLDDSLKVIGSQKRNHNGKSYTVRIGKKGNAGSKDRSYIYSADTWTESEARNHCKSHGGKFEPATRKIREYIDPEINKMIKTEE